MQLKRLENGYKEFILFGYTFTKIKVIKSVSLSPNCTGRKKKRCVLEFLIFSHASSEDYEKTMRKIPLLTCVLGDGFTLFFFISFPPVSNNRMVYIFR